jgi:hypothetical protein
VVYAKLIDIQMDQLQPFLGIVALGAQCTLRQLGAMFFEQIMRAERKKLT